MSRIYVMPSEPGQKVPLEAHEQDGVHLYLPAEGREVESNGYWSRRLRDGDVVEAKPEAKAKSGGKP